MNKGSKKNEILFLHSKGEKQEIIAKKLGITQAAVSLCLKRSDIKTHMRHIFEIEKRIEELKTQRDTLRFYDHSHFLLQGMINGLEWVLSKAKGKK